MPTGRGVAFGRSLPPTPDAVVPLVLVLAALLVGRLVDVPLGGRPFVVSAIDLVAVAVAVWGLVVARRRGTWRLDPALLGHVGLVVVVLLQLIGGDDRLALVGGSSRIVGPALLLLGLSQLVTGRDDDPAAPGLRGASAWPRALVGFGVLLAVWVLGLAIAGALDPDNVGFYDFKTVLVMPLGASNYLAGFLLVPLGVAVAMVAEDRRYLLPAGVVGLGLLATLSRGAFLAAAAAAVVLVLVRTVRRSPRWVVGALGVLALLTVAVAVTDFDATGQSTVDGRLRLWAASWDGFAAGPLLGVGFNDLLDVTAVLEQQHPNAHNLLLHGLATTGLLGTAAYLVLWGALATRLVAADPSPRRDALLVGASALFVHAQSEALAFTRAVEALLVVLLVASALLPATRRTWATPRVLPFGTVTPVGGRGDGHGAGAEPVGK